MSNYDGAQLFVLFFVAYFLTRIEKALIRVEREMHLMRRGDHSPDGTDVLAGEE